MELGDDENIEWLMQSSATVEQVVADDVEHEMREDEERQLQRFLRILRESFRSDPFIDGGIAGGVVASDEGLQAMLRDLKALGYFYAIRTSRTYSRNKKIMLKCPKFITDSKHPYVVNRQINYYCSCGREYNKQLRQRLETSQRVTTDCKATLSARHVFVFTKAKIPLNRDRRLLAMNNLREDMSAGRAPFHSELWVSVSLPRMHHHPIYSTGHPLDTEVAAAMHSLVANGAKTSEEIQTEIRRIVSQEFGKGPARPAPNNSAFFPSLKVIYNHLNRDGLQRKRYKKREKRVTAEKVKEDVKSTMTQVLDYVDQCSDVTVLNSIHLIVHKVRNRLEPQSVSTRAETCETKMER